MLDYLSEVSMSIMAIQREKEPLAGYAKDFLDVVKSLIPLWKQGAKVRIVTNAGGLNPMACAQAVRLKFYVMQRVFMPAKLVLFMEMMYLVSLPKMERMQIITT